jgi:hypothetical protein
MRCSRRWHTDPVRLPRPTSKLAQAVVPVALGLGVIIVIGLALWLVAVLASGHADKVRLGAPTFQVGRVDRLADTVARDGPLLFPGLVGPAGRRPIGLAHTGGDDASGWRAFSLVPRGADASCLVTQPQRDRQLVDCHGQPVGLSDLPDATGVTITVTSKGVLVLDLTP